MATTKKATVKKPVETVKVAPKAAEVVEVKTEAKAEVKAETKAAPAKKAPAKKAPAKKAAAKAGSVKIQVEFSGKSYTTEDLVKIAKDVWKFDLKKKASDFKDVEIYVKPEENQAYYVINGEVKGNFAL